MKRVAGKKQKKTTTTTETFLIMFDKVKITFTAHDATVVFLRRTQRLM